MPSRDEILQAALRLALLIKKHRRITGLDSPHSTNPENLRGVAGPAGTFPERRAK